MVNTWKRTRQRRSKKTTINRRWWKQGWDQVCLDTVLFPCSLRKQPTFRDATTGFPAKWRLRNEYRNSIMMTYLYPDSDWLWQICFNQSEALPRSGQWHVISIEFLYSFLIFAEKPVVAVFSGYSPCRCKVHGCFCYQLNLSLPRSDFLNTDCPFKRALT